MIRVESPAQQVVNFAGYRFVDLPDRDELRQPFRDICAVMGLKGTILLSPNGINFFLAGSQEGGPECRSVDRLRTAVPHHDRQWLSQGCPGRPAH